MRDLLLLTLFCCFGYLPAQTVYPPDSLTTAPAIPPGAVMIPAGLPSGPEARMRHAIYYSVRFPRSAMTTRTGGKIVVYGVVDTVGLFRADSAAFYRQQVATGGDERLGRTMKPDVKLGTVSVISWNGARAQVGDFSQQWTAPQRALVVEAIRVACSLPAFRPATIRGRKVNAFLEVPVVFRHG